MDKKKILIPFLIIPFIIMVITLPVNATSKNKKAGKAFATALANGTINYNKNMNYSIADMDGDGVKDLLINNSSLATVYSYKNGRINKIIEFCPEYILSYDSKKKVFFEMGSGSGEWVMAHKFKNGRLIMKYSYSSRIEADNTLSYHYRTTKTSKNISKKAFCKMQSYAKKTIKHTTKKKTD